MKDPMKSLLAPGRPSLTADLMRGSGSCIDDIRANGERYRRRVAVANAAPPLSEAYEGTDAEPQLYVGLCNGL